MNVPPSLYQNALDMLQKLTTSQGILASTQAADNYQRVWSRDSMICGIAGMLAEDEKVTNGLKESLLALSRHQHPLGMIPSNVKEDGNEYNVSYGSLVGRVDANTWFIVGACLYFLNTNDTETWNLLEPKIRVCRRYLKTQELNGKGWLYTPLSGNWADEFPTQGYTIYDNALRLWGETLWRRIQKDDTTNLESLKNKTRINFWPSVDIESQAIYQRKSYLEATDVQHFCTNILPGHYNTRFDAAGNAMALLIIPLNAHQKEKLRSFLKTLRKEVSNRLIPAFWPPINTSDWEWNLLQQNYSYEFKNLPNHFHNGGIWPVWMGWFCLGLVHQGMQEEAGWIISDFVPMTTSESWNFQEYISSENFDLCGKEQMGFTASGIVFMHHALNDNSFKTKLGL